MSQKSSLLKKSSVVKSQSDVKVKKVRSGVLPHWEINDAHLINSIDEVLKLGIQMTESTKDLATPKLKHTVMDLIVAGLNRRKGGTMLNNDQERMI